jgi:sensor histidine kinase regulating citrate/malate metabolism
VLHAVSEGLVITDLDGTLRLANDEAVRLLDLPADAIGRPVADLGLTDPLVAALTDDLPHEDELHVTSARVLVLNRGPATWRGRLLGHVATLRDRTDLEALTGELDSARGLTDALRSQAHESANRLHTIVSLIELGHTDRALAFATEELQVSQVLTDRVVGAVDEPVLTALLLGKAAEAHERGIAFEIEPGAHWPRDVAPTRDIVTIVGNLIDNALDAVAGETGTPRAERHVSFDSRVDGAYAVLEVSDDGPGLPPGAAKDAFRRGWSTKEQGSAGRRGIGLALVGQTVDRLGGTLEVSGPPGATFTVRLPVGGGDG